MVCEPSSSGLRRRRGRPLKTARAVCANHGALLELREVGGTLSASELPRAVRVGFEVAVAVLQSIVQGVPDADSELAEAVETLRATALMLAGEPISGMTNAVTRIDAAANTLEEHLNG